MTRDVLLVDPNLAVLRVLKEVLALRATVDACDDFNGARQRLIARAPDLLVANIRLGDYNGLHLVYFAAVRGLPTRAIVYGEPEDLPLARDAQAAGAFYVRGAHLAAALPAYLEVQLPTGDRRDVVRGDRRHLFRGGRRAVDQQGSLPLAL